MLTRRSIVAALPLLGLAAKASDPARDLLARAIVRAGGREALIKARVLRWTGDATVHAGDRTLEIGVDTMVEPFVRARSRSWLKSDGPAKSRTMILEPDQGWIERAGKKESMPEAMRLHELQQFRSYGYMRLVDLEGPHIVVTREGEALRVRSREHYALETLLRFDSEAKLIGLENEVESPDGGAPIPQKFTFQGNMPGPIAWPQRISIMQRDKPYFELRLTSFSASER